jgi:hypothetical protein
MIITILILFYCVFRIIYSALYYKCKALREKECGGGFFFADGQKNRADCENNTVYPVCFLDMKQRTQELEDAVS